MADPVQSDARAARLAAALRANLARRKARDRSAPAVRDTHDDGGPSPELPDDGSPPQG